MEERLQKLQEENDKLQQEIQELKEENSKLKVSPINKFLGLGKLLFHVTTSFGLKTAILDYLDKISPNNPFPKDETATLANALISRLRFITYTRLFFTLLPFSVVIYQSWLLTNQNKIINEQLTEQAKQNEYILESFRNDAYIAVVDKQLELNKLLVENPSFNKFFILDNQLVEKNNPNYHEILAVSDFFLDYFDLYYSQSNYFLPADDEFAIESRRTWEKYIKDSFQNIPILCKRLNEVKDYYTKDFKNFSGCSIDTAD
ncbi:hypothetical protein [Dendronalium sp. ChiSLP03b]|uniref:hypothetical protein n=1 Tax=Dendronalium sp. ChiSLP03b TaxID=3075381 RepID=UPI002AD32720|nr:hypothetical protein [Dendronalium sp. ChiSLP03b]MDZ8206810.1 hypothetical protein [Dendronalium sp. ChiSLP03b]